MWRREVQENGQIHFLKTRLNGVAKGDINHDPNFGGFDRRWL
ncbi:hypothetical protein SAMN05216337_1015126 [Bradyrhizobium brasilense]|uniref:Uncharacterized protein n=1 Tax=Bradyrhizobium brasilense TaxID=1419277 RepID=A0A1G6XTB0_9BRAD|nr:hypothetical protein SAMN05216337_1015126 [Bradyrhizobium brasilense]